VPTLRLKRLVRDTPTPGLDIILKEVELILDTGPDEISARILKGTINSIVPTLTKLFNLLSKTNSFPELWKCARIV